MANHTVPLVGAAVLVALAAVLWSTTREDGEAIDAELTPVVPDAPLATDATAPPADAAVDDQDDAAASSVDVESASGTDVTGDAEPAVDETAVAPDSPFTTTATDPTDDVVDTSAANASGEPAALAVDDTSADAGDDGEARAGERLVVPSSYPISDAAKYYLPPDQRGPGNLGGPPPLDFPGGPNDPNREGGGFAPPAAPGR